MDDYQSLKPHQNALLLAGLVTLIAWGVPIVGEVLLPLQYLNTHLHELAHALTAVLTGGHVEQILVHADGSGVTPVAGGNLILVASAGYVGAAIGGAALIVGSQSERGARISLRVFAALLALSMLLWVRGDWVGVVSGLFWVLALLGLSVVQGKWLLFMAQFIGLQQCLSSFRSVYTLIQISAIGEGHSDAGLLAANTPFPAMFWALGWCVISLLLVTVALKQAWKVPSRRDESPGYPL